jgi:hypothetical protein
MNGGKYSKTLNNGNRQLDSFSTMNREDTLSEMRDLIRRDPSGDLLAAWVSKRKQSGFTRTEAKELLTELMLECRSTNQVSAEAEEMAEGVAVNLDRVLAWCSHDHIYPDE